MRVAIVHSFYRSEAPSGENSVVLDQVDMLRAAGHEVHLLSRHSDGEFGSWTSNVRAGMRTLIGTGPSPLAELREIQPDVVHVHNLFPNFGTRWLEEWSGPLVATLHNFRPLCANGLLFRDGRICFDCPDGKPMSAVIHRCYHDSVTASAPLALRNARGVERNALVDRADRLIVLSMTAHSIYARYGVPEAKLVLLPNGLEPAPSREGRDHNGRWLFVGRLSEEKGVVPLLRDWPAGVPLDVVGEGPLGDEVRSLATESVRILGPQGREAIREMMAGYLGLVFPSVCLEMLPTVVLEALRAGIPIVAAKGSAGADLVAELQCGTTYGEGHSLAEALVDAAARRDELGVRAAAAFATHYTSEAWLARMVGLYEEVIATP